MNCLAPPLIRVNPVGCNVIPSLSGDVAGVPPDASQRRGASLEEVSDEWPGEVIHAAVRRHHAASVIDRGAFYAAAHCAMRRAGLASGTTRARRLAVRNAGLEVMQRFHVIERSRGGVPVHLPECEGIS